MQQNYLLRRTEHRGFVRYQRSDYRLTGRVLAVGRSGAVHLWTDTGLHKLRLLQSDTNQPAVSLTGGLLTLLLRRLSVRVIGCDSRRVLLALRCPESEAQGRFERIDVPPRCPDCDRPMELRQSRTGPARGLLIWECSGYPLCQAVRHLA